MCIGNSGLADVLIEIDKSLTDPFIQILPTTRDNIRETPAIKIHLNGGLPVATVSPVIATIVAAASTIAVTAVITAVTVISPLIIPVPGSISSSPVISVTGGSIFSIVTIIVSPIASVTAIILAIAVTTIIIAVAIASSLTVTTAAVSSRRPAFRKKHVPVLLVQVVLHLQGGVFETLEHLCWGLIPTLIEICAVDRCITLVQVGHRASGILHEVELPNGIGLITHHVIQIDVSAVALLHEPFQPLLFRVATAAVSATAVITSVAVITATIAITSIEFTLMDAIRSCA